MSSKYAGYMGKVIMVDLTTETVTEYPWSDEQRELYLGGKIMAARILCDHLTGKEAPFSEENWVVISTGPLTGTGAPSSARFNISALSPQTGLLASSNCGGSFGFHLKKAGYDALILKGKCQGRKWLEINEEQFTFHDAGDLWGTKGSQCQEMLQELTGKSKIGRLCIGPAGENLVKYAGIISEERAAGRTGLGAVLGWKGLKAITVTGTKTVPFTTRKRPLNGVKNGSPISRATPSPASSCPNWAPPVWSAPCRCTAFSPPRTIPQVNSMILKWSAASIWQKNLTSPTRAV